jgi:hypothetical protein
VQKQEQTWPSEQNRDLWVRNVSCHHRQFQRHPQNWSW